MGTDGSVTVKNYFNSSNTINSNNSMKILVENQYYIYTQSGLFQSVGAPDINAAILPVNESSNQGIVSLQSSEILPVLPLLKDNPITHNQQQKAQRCNCQACSNNKKETGGMNMIGSSNLFYTL
jgi:hypothetical protein